MNIKEIIQRLKTAMDDARGQESHFESWLTQNEGICDAIDALKELYKTEQEPVASCNGMPAYEGPLSKTQRTWVGLTTDDWDEIRKQVKFNFEMTTGEYAERVSHLVEDKLREKNT